jgi:hypothetical protein
MRSRMACAVFYVGSRKVRSRGLEANEIKGLSDIRRALCGRRQAANEQLSDRPGLL